MAPGTNLLPPSPLFLFLKKNLFIYFCLCWVFTAVHGLSLVVMNGCYSPVAEPRFLIAVASFVAEHGLQSTDSVVVVWGLSCPKAYRMFSDQESNPCPLHCQKDSWLLGCQGSPPHSPPQPVSLPIISDYQSIAKNEEPETEVLQPGDIYLQPGHSWFLWTNFMVSKNSVHVIRNVSCPLIGCKDTRCRCSSSHEEAVVMSSGE